MKILWRLAALGALFYLLLPASGTFFYLRGIRWLYVFSIAFLATHLLVPVASFVGNRFKIMDQPEARKIHSHPVPRTGGIAVFLGFLFALFRNLHFETAIFGILLASSLVVALGIWDDKRGASATTKIIVQVFIAAILIVYGDTLSFIPRGFPGERFWEALITVVWVIGITNAINFLDGMDGLATGLGIIGSLLFFAILLDRGLGQSPLGYLNVAFIGSLLAFLPYNFHFFSREPARIFLGDAGSTFIGFFLASTAVLGSWAEGNPTVALSTPLLILGVVIFDMLYTTLSRFANGQVRTIREWLEYVGQDHLHHRLNKLGLVPHHAVCFIWAVSLALGFSALVIRHASSRGAILLLCQATILFLIIVVLMRLGREREGA